MKFHTILTAKAEVIKPNSEEFKAMAAVLKTSSYGFDLKPQMDLLYVRSCLVSAGTSVGVNDNDDIFTREEVWAARQTPVLKPFNWQHNDKDILGVIYTVQARDLEGNILDINDEAVPDRDFDLWVEAAIFRLIHEARANEIEARAAAGTLFVSMEAWFDDYSYGFCNTKGSQLNKVVNRNKGTAFLDRHLRAGGGSGVYRDPELNQDVRIGRVLREITFGGCGFVDRPANKRSKIEAVEPMNSLAERDTEQQLELLFQRVLESQVEDISMNMHAQANTGVQPEVVTAAVESALDKREKAAAAERERTSMVARATAAEDLATELQNKNSELLSAQEAKDAEVQTLRSQLDEYGKAVEQLVRDQVAAGATSSTPAEITAIDNAKTGAEAFKAKIAWISKSMASLKERAARAQELEDQLAEAEAVVREQEVRNLLGSVVSEEALETFVSHAASLEDAAYTHWRDEKELIVLEIARSAKKEMPFPPKGKKGEKPMPVEKECANLFEALLTKRRLEAGSADPDTMRNNPNEPDLINTTNTGETDVKSGVNPGQLRTPRHKIAGTAGNDPTKSLENAQEEGSVQLAGAQASGGGDGVSAFRVLANLVTDNREEDEKAPAEKPGFDPVQ